MVLTVCSPMFCERGGTRPYVFRSVHICEGTGRWSTQWKRTKRTPIASSKPTQGNIYLVCILILLFSIFQQFVKGLRKVGSPGYRIHFKVETQGGWYVRRSGASIRLGIVDKIHFIFMLIRNIRSVTYIDIFVKLNII